MGFWKKVGKVAKEVGKVSAVIGTNVVTGGNPVATIAVAAALFADK